MAELTKVTDVVLDGSLTGKTENNKLAETAGRIAGNPLPNKIYGTNKNGVQEFLIPGDKDFPQVYSAEFADKLFGNPVVNSVWSTDENGLQGWRQVSDGNMNSSIYDPSNSGKVQYSEVADKISGSPLPNFIWGTNNLGRQIWLPLNIEDVMLKSVYANVDTNSNLVDSARTAEQIRSGAAADNNTVYTKDSEGHFNWRNIDTLFQLPADVMLKTEYDKSNSGKIDFAEEASIITSSKNASNSTFYGKGADGVVGFKEIQEISPQVMLKSEYDPTNSGKLVADSLVCSDIENGSVWMKTDTGQEWVKLPEIKLPELTILTGRDNSIVLTSAGTWNILYSVDGVAKVEVMTIEEPFEYTFEESENIGPSWAIKIS